MIFNGSNVKVIHMNGYLTKYVGKTAPYFPFTLEDCKNNVIILHDNTFSNGSYFYLTANDLYYNSIYFIGFLGNGAIKISFNFINKTISSKEYTW